MIALTRIVFLTRAEIDELLDYSCSLPTGQTVGKQWKRRCDYYDESQGWLRGEYCPDPDPKYVQIEWRDIVEVPFHGRGARGDGAGMDPRSDARRVGGMGGKWC